MGKKFALKILAIAIVLVMLATSGATMRNMESEKSAESSEYGFTASEALKVFDTGAPANLYPSLFGTHNGTIKPNTDINISRLYTYSCPGTGGHSEYIRIYNESGTLTEGYWNGYHGDYRNITLIPSIKLLRDHEYKYTIITGSYPQIHHTDRVKIDEGVITCASFVDATGKRYNDWIPAIRLENFTSTHPAITITAPEEGDTVSWREIVEGTSEGIYGSDLNIYVLIYPIEAGGPWWVQPDVDISHDGSWEVNCYFGRDPESHPEDIGDHFRVCAIITTQKLSEGQQWQKLPFYVIKSQTIEVIRGPS